MDTFFIKIKRLVWGTIYTSKGAGKKNNEETRSEEERFFKHDIVICSWINFIMVEIICKYYEIKFRSIIVT